MKRAVATSPSGVATKTRVLEVQSLVSAGEEIVRSLALQAAPISREVDPELCLHLLTHTRPESGARWLDQATELVALLQPNVVRVASLHTLSAVLSEISAHTRCEDIEALEAVVNRLLESSASSFFASAFKPFRIAAARYAYRALRLPAEGWSELASVTRLLNTLKRMVLFRTADRENTKGSPDSSLVMSDAHYCCADTFSARTVRLPLAIRPTLESFRALLSRSWSLDTVHQETVLPSHWSAGNPQGQCGVSSAWLAEVLAREYSVTSTFCRGFLIFGQQKAENVLDHCWLEIAGAYGEEIVVDLTCDQARGFDRQIVFDAKADLELQQINYITRDRLKVSDLDRTPVWPRYWSLRRTSERVKTRQELRVEASQHVARVLLNVLNSPLRCTDIVSAGQRSRQR